jgi:hypothetical protein
MIGIYWYNNGEKSKMLKPCEFQEYINNGWIKGRTKFSNSFMEKMKIINSTYNGMQNKRYINNGVINKIIKLDELDKYLNDDCWILGKIKKKGDVVNG